MAGVRFWAGRCLTMVCVALAVGAGQAGAQTQRSRVQRRARRETNASRQARILRTTEETYAHRWEVFGGGGYLRWRSGEYTQKNNEVSWAAATNYFLTPKFSVVGDARGSFGYAKAERNGFFTQNTKPEINEYFFTGGVSYRFYATEKMAVSAQALGGTAWGIFSGGATGLRGTDLGLWQDGFRPAVILEVAADFNVYPNLAVRIAPTYVGTDFTGGPGGGSFQNNFGINGGVVYRFGHH